MFLLCHHSQPDSRQVSKKRTDRVVYKVTQDRPGTLGRGELDYVVVEAPLSLASGVLQPLILMSPISNNPQSFPSFLPFLSLCTWFLSFCLSLEGGVVGFGRWWLVHIPVLLSYRSVLCLLETNDNAVIVG